jgi:4-hydroxybenzoate polyprenyltransferase
LIESFTVSIWFGAYAVLLAFFGVFYNVNPLRTKEILWVNLVWQALSRGLLLYPAVFAAYGKPFSPVGWALGIIGFLLVLSLQNTADFADVEVDEKFDITTPAVYHGFSTLVKIMTVVAVAMFVTLTIMIREGVIPNLWSLYLLLIPVGIILKSLWDEPGGITGIGDNHISWYGYYTCLAMLYILPSFQLLLGFK